MSEPGLLQSPSAARQESLWEHAPAWRNLTIAASLLTLAAIATPMLWPQAADGAKPPPVVPMVAAAVPPSHVTPPAVVPSNVPQDAKEAPPKSAIARTAHHTHAQIASAVPAPPATPRPVEQPPLVAQQQQNFCPLRQQSMPIPAGSGIVIGFFTPEQTQARVASDEARMGGTITPDFATRQRVVIRPDFENRGRLWVSVLPEGMQVALGDHVTYNTAYRDQSRPCSYIPTLITADQGPAAAMQQVQQGVP